MNSLGFWSDKMEGSENLVDGVGVGNPYDDISKLEVRNCELESMLMQRIKDSEAEADAKASDVRKSFFSIAIVAFIAGLSV